MTFGTRDSNRRFIGGRMLYLLSDSNEYPRWGWLEPQVPDKLDFYRGPVLTNAPLLGPGKSKTKKLYWKHWSSHRIEKGYVCEKAGKYK